MRDLISRQAAIDAVQNRHMMLSKEKVLLINDLEKLPSAEPNRGTWIDTGSNEEWYAREYRCSECGDTMLGEANYCPNCGAKMEVTNGN